MKSILFGVTIPITASAFLKPQIKALISEGWDVHLVCNLEPGVEELTRITGLHVHPITMKREPSPIRDITSLYRWINLLRKLKPNIVIGSTPKAALLSMLGSKFTKIPVRIYHARGFRAEGLTGITKKISLITEKITIKFAAEVLCDSESLRKSLIRHGCLPNNSGIVLGKGSCCGVDTDFYIPPTALEKKQARQRLGFANDDFVIGFVGRVTRDKGIYELIKAGVESNQQDPRVKIVIVGPNEKDFTISKNFSNTQVIQFLGPKLSVRDYYWVFDVFVLPSYREGFPIAPLEAQACGLPLITTTATGCIDSQPPENSMLLIRPREHKEISALLMLLIANPKLRATAGSRARKWVVDNFHSKDVIQNQNNFLKNLLN